MLATGAAGKVKSKNLNAFTEELEKKIYIISSG
jgi:hypothetical protein